VFGGRQARGAQVAPAGTPGFFAAEARACRDTRRGIVPLKSLYHLFNHLDLFDGGYLGAVRRMLKQCAWNWSVMRHF
jgi:hypothetical protein